MDSNSDSPRISSESFRDPQNKAEYIEEGKQHATPSSQSIESHPLSSETALVPPIPEPVSKFFESVSLEGFPKSVEKAQPWKTRWNGPQEPSKDGRLLVACPKICNYGSNNLGGI